MRFLLTPTKVELHTVSWNIYDGSDGLDLTLEFGWVIFFYGFWKPRYSGVIAYPIRSMFCRSFRPKRLILWPWCCRDRRRRPGIWWNHFCGFLRARPATKKKILIYRILRDWCISIHGWLILFGKLKGKNQIYIYIYDISSVLTFIRFCWSVEELSAWPQEPWLALNQINSNPFAAKPRFLPTDLVTFDFTCWFMTGSLYMVFM